MELRPYQQQAIDALMSYWRSKPTGIPLIVAPCGSGKSPICAEICRLALSVKPKYRIMVVTHKAKIVEQNARHLIKALNVPIGIYAAKLDSKTVRGVTCATINSIYKKKWEIDLCIIDECHLLSGEDSSMYGKFIDTIQSANPNVKIVGLTASPFRLDQGSLIGQDSFFTDIAYEIKIRELIEAGFLSQLISMPSKNKTDLTGVKISGSDFNQTDVENVMFPFIEDHCKEIIANGINRKHWLIFCSGIRHAKEMAKIFNEMGISSAYIASDQPHFEQEITLQKFHSGEIKALCNVEMMTIGYDFAPIDLLALCRATKSVSLYLQICGRASRIAEGKKNAMILDFGSNIDRLGPLDCINVSRKTKNGKVEIAKAPTKECPECGAIVSIRVLECSCGYMFSHASTVAPKATSAPIISEAEILDVDSVTKKIHNKDGKPPSLKVEYKCGLRYIYDFLCFEHGGYASQMAHRKWKLLADNTPRGTLDAFQTPTRTPKQIEVIKEGKWYRVIKWLGTKDPEPDYFEELGINI